MSSLLNQLSSYRQIFSSDASNPTKIRQSYVTGALMDISGLASSMNIETGGYIMVVDDQGNEVSITKSTQYQLEKVLGIHVVTTKSIEDESYSLHVADSLVYEGGSTTLSFRNSSNIVVSPRAFTIFIDNDETHAAGGSTTTYSHQINETSNQVSGNAAIGASVIRSRISVDADGNFYVAAPKDNAGWDDNVTVYAYPAYLTLEQAIASSQLLSVTILCRAIKYQSLEIKVSTDSTGLNEVTTFGPGNTYYVSAVFSPSNNTKASNLGTPNVSLVVSGGPTLSMGNILDISATQEKQVTIQASIAEYPTGEGIVAKWANVQTSRTYDVDTAILTPTSNPVLWQVLYDNGFLTTTQYVEESETWTGKVSIYREDLADSTKYDNVGVRRILDGLRSASKNTTFNELQYCTSCTAITQSSESALTADTMKITEITLPPNCKTVSAYGLCNTNLTSIKNINSVTTLGNYALANNDSLNTLQFDRLTNTENVQSIFSGSTIASLVFNSIETLGNDMFRGVTKITSLTINSALTTLDTTMFYSGENTNRTWLNILAYKIPNVQSLPDYAFYGNTVATFTISDAMTSIPAYCFFGTTKTGNISSTTITSIGSYAYGNCTGISSVNLPNCTTVGNTPFSGCTNLISIVLGITGTFTRGLRDTYFTSANLSKIQYYTFNGITGLGSSSDTSSNGVFASNTRITQFTATSLSRIYNYAFYGANQLRAITAANVSYIYNYAFSGCTNLSSINFTNVRQLGDYAFQGIKVTSALSYANLSSVGQYAFKDSSITSLTAPNLTAFGAYCFSNSKLQSIIAVKATSISATSFENLTTLKTLQISGCSAFNGIFPDAVVNSLTSLTINNVTWTNEHTTTLQALASINTVNIRGTIALLDTEKLGFRLKLKLISRFGPVDDTSNSLHITYTVIQFTGFNAVPISGDKYPTESQTYYINPIEPTVNDIRNVTWSLSDNEYATINSQTGLLTVNSLGSDKTATAALIATAVVPVYNEYNIETGTQEITATMDLYFFNRAAAVGDYVFADGSYQDEPRIDKTCIGRCFYVDNANNDRRMVSLVDVSTGVRNKLGNSTASATAAGISWGLFPNGASLGANGFPLSGDDKITLSDNSTYDCFDTPMRNITNSNYIYATLDTLLNTDGEGNYLWGQFKSYGPNTYTSGTTSLGLVSCADEDLKLVTISTTSNGAPLADVADLGIIAGTAMPSGKYKTLSIIQHRNKILNDSRWSDIGCKVPVATVDKTETQVLIETAANTYSIISNDADLSAYAYTYMQLYYMAASLCYAYQPTDYTALLDGEVLADKFKSHNWWLPSAGENVRLYYWSKLHKPTIDNIEQQPPLSKVITDTSYHWCSTESNSGYSWAVNFLNGYLAYGNKYYSYVVRAVAAF